MTVLTEFADVVDAPEHVAYAASVVIPSGDLSGDTSAWITIANLFVDESQEVVEVRSTHDFEVELLQEYGKDALAVVPELDMLADAIAVNQRTHQLLLSRRLHVRVIHGDIIVERLFYFGRNGEIQSEGIVD